MDDADKEPEEILLDLSPAPSEDESFLDLSQDSPDSSRDSFIPVKSRKRNRLSGAQPEISSAVPATGKVVLKTLVSTNNSNNIPIATGTKPKANRNVLQPHEINACMGGAFLRGNSTSLNNINSLGRSISPGNPTSQTGNNPARIRQYPFGEGNKFIVYFRPKGENKLDRVQIAKSLEKGYKGVESIRRVNNNKMIVVVNNAKDANDIVRDASFSQHYRVWIPAHVVEIDGVVTEDSLRLEDLKGAKGHFRQPGLPSVDIIEYRQMGSMKGEGENKTFTPSSSFRLTFAGSALPDFILIGKLRLSVRLFRPKIMSCSNCQQLGHTMSHCSNKSKCSKCGESHKDDICQNVSDKCFLCGGNRHVLKECPKYKERSIKLKKSLIDRSKKSFADIVKTSEHNRYEVLTDESDDDEDANFSSTEENYTPEGDKQAPKRKKPSRSTPAKRVTRASSDGETRVPMKQLVPPTRNNASYDKEFPIIPTKPQQNSQKSCSAAGFTPKPLLSNDTSHSAYSISLSSVIEMIIQFFELPESISGFIKHLLPVLQKLCSCIAAKWPLFSELINIHA